MKLSYLDLMTTDPSYNLAMEQYVFDCLPRDRMYFMLWQNDNAIIVGKYQNTISEINEEAVRAGDGLGDCERRHQRGHDRRYAGAAARAAGGA